MTTESISGLDLQGSSLDVAVKMVCYNVWTLHAEEGGIAGQRVFWMSKHCKVCYNICLDSPHRGGGYSLIRTESILDVKTLQGLL